MESTEQEKEIQRIKEKLEELEKDPLQMALFGQPGSGKSSIINSLVGKKVAEINVRTDTTTEAQVVEYTKDLVLVDLPGYGTSKFPPDSFLKEFKVQDYHLFLCVFSGKFHQADTQFFQELKQKGRICLFVRSKSDEIWEEDKSLDELKAEITKDVEKQIQERAKVYFVSNKTPKEGFDKLSEAIRNHISGAYQDRWARSAKAWTTEALEQKKKACENLISDYAFLLAVSDIIPLLTFLIEDRIGFKVISKIQKSYGLTEEKMKKMIDKERKENLSARDIKMKYFLYLFSEMGTSKEKYKKAQEEINNNFTEDSFSWKQFFLDSIPVSAQFQVSQYLSERWKSFLDIYHMFAENILNEELKKTSLEPLLKRFKEEFEMKFKKKTSILKKLTGR